MNKFCLTLFLGLTVQIGYGLIPGLRQAMTLGQFFERKIKKWQILFNKLSGERMASKSKSNGH